MKRISWREFYEVAGEYIQALFKIIKQIRIDAMNADREFMKNHKKRKYTIISEKVNKDRLLEIEGALLHRRPELDERQVIILHNGMGENNFNGVLKAIKEYEEFVAIIAGPGKVPLRPAALETVIKDQNDVIFYP